MNERTKKLAIIANPSSQEIYESDSWQFNCAAWSADDLEKFAELIVRECMELALLEQKRYAAFTHRNLSECAVTVSNFRLLLKEHFGVKE